MAPNCLRGKFLDVMETQADTWIRFNKETKPELASLFKQYLGNKPVCQWIGDWTPNPRQATADIANHATVNNTLFQLVLYNIPNRDTCGFSAGGAGSKANYISWIGAVAAGIGSVEGIIIVEPDALAHAVELDANRRDQRLALLREVVAILRKKCKNAHIYIDAGHPNWLSHEVAVELLIKAGLRFAHGISLNVSNSQLTENCYKYGLKIVESISEVHGMVIDTSRNGFGAPPPHVTGVDAWANPPTSRLGRAPTLRVPPPNIFSNRLHALLWVKVPGESDGAYKGAPGAGTFWPEGALRLIDGSNAVEKFVST